jgi:hypothetical protein
VNVCAFCGPTKELLSPEDIWPHWMSVMIRRNTNLPFKRVDHLTLNKNGTVERETHQRLKAQAEVVCKPCNNEWMSRLETAAKPLLESFIQSPKDSRTLNDADCLTIAAWVTLKAIVVDHLSVLKYHRKPFFTQSQRTDFKHMRRPPDRISVWVGQLDPYLRGGDMRPLYTNALPRSREIKHLEGYSFTISMLSFAAQLLAVKQVRLPDRRSRFAATSFEFAVGPNHATWDDLTPQVWPFVGDVGWPPRLPLIPDSGHSGFDFLACRFVGMPPCSPPLGF